MRKALWKLCLKKKTNNILEKNMQIIVKNIENINNSLFNIYDDKNIFPVAININGQNYQISSFQNNSQYIYYGEKTAEDAINIFTGFINNVTYKVLVKIYEICKIFNADISKINIFSQYNIKGRKSFESLEKSINLPKELLDFIDKKDIPLKTTSLIISQNENIINFLNGAVIYNDFSVQGFRKYVEKICDFKEIIPDKYSSDFVFPDVKSASHKEIEENYFKLINTFKNIKVSNIDSFETPKLNISFDINNIEDYEKIINELMENKENIKLFYEILDKYGLI